MLIWMACKSLTQADSQIADALQGDQKDLDKTWMNPQPMLYDKKM